MKLSGNTVLITGGSSGIGYALAEAFLHAGNTVVVCARGTPRLIDAQRNHPDLHIHACDIADEGARRELAAFVAEHFPTLNVLVNNAGVQRDIDLTRGAGEFLAGDNEIRVNLEGPIVLSALLIPLLARNPRPAVVNVSSGLAFVPMARVPVYCASKAGMHAFSMVLRVQLARIGVKVFEVVPPMVDTALNAAGRADRSHSRGNPQRETRQDGGEQTADGQRGGMAPEEFVAAVMRGLEDDTPEIGYGMTAGYVNASRAELDRRFAEANAGF